MDEWLGLNAMIRLVSEDVVIELSHAGRHQGSAWSTLVAGGLRERLGARPPGG